MPINQVPSYSIGVPSGVMASGLAANSPILAFRWSHATKLAVVKSLTVSAGGITAFTAGAAAFDLFTARSWSVNDTGGAAIAWTVAGSNRRRGTMGNSNFATPAGEIRASATATLTAGTRTLDTNALASAVGSTTATAGTAILPPTDLVRAVGYAIVLADNEGLVVQATVPAAGTWRWAVTVDWEEYTSDY